METRVGREATFTFSVIQGDQALAGLERLLNHAFRVPPGPSSYYDDFPVWHERHGQLVFRVGAFRDGELVASALIREARLKTPYGALPVAILGGVATEEHWRGHGLATRAVSLALEWAKARRLAAVFLWGSEHDLYRRQGFELCGVQARLPLSTFAAADAGKTTVNRGWTPGIFGALTRRPHGLTIGSGDIAWLAAHRNVDWYWTGPAAAPTAYLAVGRGIDLAGFAHEWGGERAAFLELARGVNAATPGLELLGSPSLFQAYGLAHDPAAIEYLCMAKVLDPRQVFESFRAHADYPLSGVAEGDLPRALFGPDSVTGVPVSILPLPLWLWGLDGS